MLHSKAFTINYKPKCFVFMEIHGKDPDKYSNHWTTRESTPSCFWQRWVAFGILIPQPGIEPGPQQGKRRVLNKYSKVYVSDNFKIVTLNWVRLYKTLMKTGWFIKLLTQDEAKQELTGDWMNWWRWLSLLWFNLNIAGSFMFCFPDLKDLFSCLLRYL